jgi:hypothetical protein
VKKIITSMLPDALMVSGSAGISYGAWMVYPPAGFLVAGALLLVAGILAARVAVK